ncbi:MAG: hypothetical protein H6938_02160 [Burkholderiales bacterium]|nr:hypothetical protein [Burkholderiales bacterium]
MRARIAFAARRLLSGRKFSIHAATTAACSHHCFGGKADVIDAENLNAWRQSVAMLSEVFGFLNVEFINVRKSGDRVAIPLWRKPLLQLV